MKVHFITIVATQPRTQESRVIMLLPPASRDPASSGFCFVESEQAGFDPGPDLRYKRSRMEVRMLGLQGIRIWAPVLLAFMVIAAQPALADEKGDADAEIEFMARAYGVRVHYGYSREGFFPRAWREKAGYVHGRQASLNQVLKALPVIQEFLAAYPTEVVADHLTDVFLLGRLEMMGHPIGGTYGPSWLYVLVSPRLSEKTLLSTLHHEFSSILMRRHPFPAREWEQANEPGWKYAGGSRNMIEEIESEGKSHQPLSADLFSRGFLTSYGQSCVEDDFNVYGSWLFTRRQELNSLAEQYPRIRKKRDLCVRFYQSLSPEFEFDG